MTIHKIKVLEVCHNPAWNKWPETDDTDYSDVLAYKWERRYTRGDVTIDLTAQRFPAFHAYHQVGCRELPGGLQPTQINSIIHPPQEVMDQQVRDLEHFGKGFQVLSWPGVFQCFAPVAAHLKRIFNFAVLATGDDCPGSSEYKTFPVCPFFDLAQHQMYVWNYETGQLTGDEYRKRGTTHTKFLAPGGGSSGFTVKLADDKFDIQEKIRRIRSGELTYGLAYVGLNGYPNPLRVSFLTQLNSEWQRVHDLGLKTGLWGIGMRDGMLGQKLHPKGPGLFVAPVYQDALFTINYPVSSIFNSRLIDAWESGVIQLIPDKHGELAALGFKDGEHFIMFDGTLDGCIEKLREWKDRTEDLAKMAEAGYKARFQLSPKNPDVPLSLRYLFEYTDQIVGGRTPSDDQRSLQGRRR